MLGRSRLAARDASRVRANLVSRAGVSGQWPGASGDGGSSRGVLPGFVDVAGVRGGGSSFDTVRSADDFGDGLGKADYLNLNDIPLQVNNIGKEVKTIK